MRENNLNRNFGLDVIETTLEAFEDAHSVKSAYRSLRHFLPYCLVKVGEYWVPLNRDYKPLGTRRGWYDYEKYLFMGIEAKYVDEAMGRSNPMKETELQIFLYSDSTTPITAKMRRSYFERLRKVFVKSADSSRVRAGDS